MTIVSTRSIAGSVGGHRRLELVAQVREVRPWVDRAADDALHGLSRRELPAERVDVLAQPRVQLVEVAALDLLVDIEDRRAGLLPDLDGEDGAEQVGGEVPEAAVGPVRVLEKAELVIRDGDPQELFEARVPRVGEILHGELSR